jgi:hypothetical protein
MHLLNGFLLSPHVGMERFYFQTLTKQSVYSLWRLKSSNDLKNKDNETIC